MQIIDNALEEGRSILTEYESKQVLAAYNLPVAREELVCNSDDLLKAAEQIGYPLIVSCQNLYVILMTFLRPPNRSVTRWLLKGARHRLPTRPKRA